MSKRLPFLIIGLSMCAAVAGCVDWSKDVAKYREVLDGKNPTTLPAYSETESLTLVRALQITNADNESIASSGENYVQALADKMRQAGTFLPTLTLDPGYTLTNSSGGGSTFINTGAGGVIDTSQFTTGGSGTRHQTTVTASASVTGSASNWSSLQSLARTVEQREQLLLDQRETILLQVVQAYYDVLRFEKQVGVFENSVLLREEQVRDQETRLKLGNGRTLDLAQSQSDLAATRVSLTQARTDALNGRSALARLMGVDAVQGSLADAFVLPADVGAYESWRDGTVAVRQDLLAAARNVESARAGVESAIRQYFPSVTINYNYYLYNDPSSNQKWAGGISANVPIFSALQIESDIRRAWSVYRQAGLSLSQTRRIVLDDIQQNFQNLKNSREKLVNLNVQVDTARRAFELSDRLYRLGSDTNLNRLTQQDNLLSAELNLIEEQFNEKRSYLALLRSSGKLATVLK